jgi:hypothetical protein
MAWLARQRRAYADKKQKQFDKGVGKMNKIRLVIILLVAAVLFAVVVVQAESDKQAQPAKIKPKASTEIQPAPASMLQAPALTGSKQVYRLVTDVLDGFGGESESNNYRIPVNSGGQPSAIGVSQSDSFVVEAGYVLAAFVNRGDANGDGIIELGDIVYLINYVFRGGDPPCPMEAGDANCDGIVELGDIVYLINYVYRSGPPPAC